ncbi:MAG: hypothetical protein AB1758_07110 [Candidatus Eremiobacterota bacterium]
MGNSTRAHELGHLRLHEGELRETRTLVTFRDELRPLEAKEERRERRPLSRSRAL